MVICESLGGEEIGRKNNGDKSNKLDERRDKWSNEKIILDSRRSTISWCVGAYCATMVSIQQK